MFKNLFNLRLLFTIVLLWVLQIGAAQKPATYETVGIAEGLSQGMVFDILQDVDGFIWVATKDGLNRYDGYNFKVYTNDPNNAKSLSSNNIVKLFQDSKNRLWIGTETEGLNIYDKRSGAFFRISNAATNPNSLSNNEIKLIEEMPNGNILVATEDGVINIITISANFFSNNEAPIIKHIKMPNNIKVNGIGNNKMGNTIIGDMDGNVYLFNGTNDSFTALPNNQLLYNGYFTNDETILINSNLYLYDGKDATPLFNTSLFPEGNIILKPNKKLWDKHHREVLFYDISKWAPNKKLEWNFKPNNDKRIIYPFVFDKAGILFAGTVGYGLRKYNFASNKFNIILPDFSIYSIVQNNIDDFFIGDVGYSWKRLLNNKVIEKPFEKIAQITQIDNVFLAKSGDYWIKSDNLGFFKYNLASNILKPYPNINNYTGQGNKQTIIEDSRNLIWFAGLGGEFMLFDTKTEQTTSFTINANGAKIIPDLATTTTIYEDKNGIYWIGYKNGFAKITLSGTTNIEAKTNWFYNNNTQNALNYNHVTCFLDDPLNANYIWIGTRGGGLNRLEKSTSTFLHVQQKDGLPDNVVYGLLADSAGNIWGSTNKGLFCMVPDKTSKNKWSFKNFTKTDGLQDNEFNTNAFAKLQNGNLAFGGVNGLNIFDPAEVLKNEFIPKVHITNILIGNKPVYPNDDSKVLKETIEFAKTITLNYKQDIITFEFASLDFTNPTQNKYRYQLVGLDKDWVESGTRHNATYLHLPSGKYTFKVQGSNSQGVWSDNIAELKIIVRPPWWKTWGAYLVYLLAMSFGIRAYFKFKVNKVKLQNQLNYQQEESKRIKELDEVKTKLYTNITHEFRTPLTVILGMAQQIKNNTAEHLDNGLNMIIRNGQSLLNLVNEMLDLSKLESGKMDLQTQTGDLINFLKYIVESFQSLAESQKKQIHFLTELDVFYTHYDAEKTRQIVANLLSNAIKFTPEKGNVYINVTESITANNSDISTIIIKVRDTGIGIPESQLENIFDRFYQLDNSATRNAEGTGIGLSLTKELVKLMGGKIEVKSPPKGADNGTEFTVILPFIKTEIQHDALKNPIHFAQPLINNEAAILKINEDYNDQYNPLILLVEDNADVVAYTASCLSNYKLAVGKDGREGFEIAVDLIPDLIVTDVMMPFVDGFEMCRKLRLDERTSHIPIIMLTAKADIESRLEGLEKGADVYLEKPFNKEELLLRIRKLLEQRKKLQQYYSSQLTTSNHADEPVKENILPVVEEPIENEFINKVKNIVIANFTNYDFNVEQLCKLVFMSHSQLHRKLDALTGQSPNKFIRMVRLQHAKVLLQNESLSIASIALDCGYNDAGYFTRVFKQEFGKTPQEFRGK